MTYKRHCSCFCEFVIVNATIAEVSRGGCFIWQGTETRKESTFVRHKKNKAKNRSRNANTCESTLIRWTCFRASSFSLEQQPRESFMPIIGSIPWAASGDSGKGSKGFRKALQCSVKKKKKKKLWQTLIVLTLSLNNHWTTSSSYTRIFVRWCMWGGWSICNDDVLKSITGHLSISFSRW